MRNINNSRKLIVPEINKKLLINYELNKDSNRFAISSSFAVSSKKDFKLIKNIISIELFLGQKPRVYANLFKKKLLVKLVANNSYNLLEWLCFLQDTPVPWNNYNSNINLFDQGFFLPSMLRTDVVLVLETKKLSRLGLWIKSAYLD